MTARTKSGRASRTNWYLAFAEWRLGIQTARTEWRTVKFFRRSASHTVIWTMVMRGHYLGQPPSVSECIRAASCSRVTARKIIVTAGSRGYFMLHPAADDHRKKLIAPSARCIADYEAMVGVFLKLADILGPTSGRATRAGRRRK